MLVNVNSALKRDEIRKLLEANENPKYVYVKNLSPMEMQFEATYKEGTDGNPADYAKKLIKSQPWGGVLMIRVLIMVRSLRAAKLADTGRQEVVSCFFRLDEKCHEYVKYDKKRQFHDTVND
ncbi:MAG: hypothetical protein U0K47_03215 [Erysipelotrichaceae bacterium]|nr:hypothetical protein [Erysipelotrichaceae bacterium]